MAVQPPPDPNRALLDLILQVREAKSPLARVRVIARAWRTVRALSPKQRYEVAVQLGLDGADDLIEAIASHRGTTPPPELMQAVNEVQKMDPATVKTIAARVRNPQQRAEGIKQGLKAIEDVLAGPEPPAPSRVPKGASPAPPPPAPAAPPTPPVVAKPATSWPLREAPAAPAPAVPPAPKPAPAPVAAPAPAPPAPQPPPPAPAPPAPVTPPPPPVAAAPPPPAPEPPREVGAPVRAGLAEHLGSIPALTTRFRHLRKHLDQVRRLPIAELRGVLEVFPDGWARRRALSELIAEGVPSRAADALSLVDVLQSPRDRAWCLGTLADTRALSPEERSALLQAASTPAGRRRLELRLGDV